jgi:hypothetical protein
MLAELYGISVSAINQHIKHIFEDGELEEKATIKKYLIVQNEVIANLRNLGHRLGRFYYIIDNC